MGQLSTRSEESRRRWTAHNVRIHTSGVKLVHQPVAGDLDLAFDSFPLPADPGQSLLIYTTEPGSPTRRMRCDTKTPPLIGCERRSRLASHPASLAKPQGGHVRHALRVPNEVDLRVFRLVWMLIYDVGL